MEYRERQGVESGPPVSVYRCRQCDETSVVIDPEADEPRCHGEPMVRVAVAEAPDAIATLSSVLADSFDISLSVTRVCYEVVTGGPASTATLADRLDCDRSTVRTALQRLTDAGFVEKTTLPREDGGTVVCYHIGDSDDARPTTLGEFCRWAACAGGWSASDIDSDLSTDVAVTAFRDAVCSD